MFIVKLCAPWHEPEHEVLACSGAGCIKVTTTSTASHLVSYAVYFH